MDNLTAAQIMLKKHNALQAARSIVYDAESANPSAMMNMEARDEMIKSFSDLLERNSDLSETLIKARDFIASDANCGPAGLGLICMIEEALNKEIK